MLIVVFSNRKLKSVDSHLPNLFTIYWRLKQANREINLPLTLRQILLRLWDATVLYFVSRCSIRIASCAYRQNDQRKQLTPGWLFARRISDRRRFRPTFNRANNSLRCRTLRFGDTRVQSMARIVKHPVRYWLAN